MTMAQDALERVLPLLRCPICAEPMDAQGDTAPGGLVVGVRCRTGHSFDRARQGHLTLFGPRGRRFAGDNTEQVLARDRVLGAGAFDPVAGLLARIAGEEVGAGPRPGAHPGPVIVEAGAGTGFYLGRVLGQLRESAPLGIGTEISVAAAKRLARSDPGTVALVADTWDRLPLADGVVDLLQVVFAPRNPAEFARVLRPGGTLVVVVPGQGHLEPLRSDAGMLTSETDKGARLEEGLAGYFSPVDIHVVDTVAGVSPEIAVDLALMGPSGVHLARTDLERVLGGRDHEVRVHVEVRTYRAAD